MRLLMKLNKVTIQNFKSLQNIEIQLGNLTLLSGMNSSGKSSFIQALLLIKENRHTIKSLGQLKLQDNELNTDLDSGLYAELGNKKQLLSYNASDDNIYFSLHSNERSYQMLIETKSNFNIKKSEGDDSLVSVFNDSCFCYLKTDRAAPANDFPYSDEKVAQNLIGLKGEYSAHYLAEKKHTRLNIAKLKHPESITDQLLENVSKWLGEISSGVSISASPYPDLQRVSLTYQYEYGDNTTGNFSPLNVGFGLTYILPVIVSILKSKPNDLIIIENPESHLHPKGQAKIAELCAIAANNDVQIIVETHSDHFLNGLRVATKNKVITADKSKIYFFCKKEGKLSTYAHNINIDDNGKLTDWPSGFFDEWDNQMDKLLW